MSRRTLSLVLACLVVCAAMLGVALNETQAANYGKVEGKISAISGSQVAFTTASGKAVTANVTSSTIIERNSQRVSLSALKIGDVGDMVFQTSGMAAVKIDVTGP